MPDRALLYGGDADLAGLPEEKWTRLNEVLSKMQVERCDLQFSQGGFVGPLENSVLKTVYLLIQKVQLGQKQLRSEQH